METPNPADPNQQMDAVWPPPPGSQVAVLGDLGCLARSHGEQDALWLGLGAELRDLDCRGLALTPVDPQMFASPVRAVWDMLT